jgi:hypothetical protein
MFEYAFYFLDWKAVTLITYVIVSQDERKGSEQSKTKLFTVVKTDFIHDSCD